MSHPRPGFDDRLNTPIEATRRGAHRARPNPMLAALPAVAAVAVVAVIIIGVWLLFGGDGEESPSAQITTSQPASTPQETQAEEQPTGEETEPVEETTTEPAAEVDRAATIVVLNSTKTTGLAGKAAAALKGKGWSGVGKTDNYRDGEISTTVFYASAEQQATAQAIADDLGVGGVEESSSVAAEGITVVVGADYSP